MRKLFFAALAALLFATPAFALEAQWTSLDVNKDGSLETLAITNVADIAFNDQGQIIGWYEKLYKGTDYKSNYDGKPNLIPAGVKTSTIPLTGTIKSEKPVTSLEKTADGGGAFLTGIFKYTQGTAIVEKKYIINSRRLTLQLETKVSGVPNYQLEFIGLGGDARAAAKALETGATEPISAGEVKQAVYASLQCCTSILNPNGQALVVRPETPVPAKVGTRQVERLVNNNKENLEISSISLTLPSDKVTKFAIYGGFNELVRLHQEKHDTLPGLFQPNIFGQLSLFLIAVFEAVKSVVGDWGLAIIILTIIIRLLITPLLMQQYRSSAEMQALQPFLVELKEKYKEDPQKLQEETMKIYQQNGINPVAGCLPAFAQMPVFLVLWKIFSNYEFDQGFLWLPDLGLPDPFYILPVLYLASSVLATWLSTRKTPDMFRQTMIIQFVFAFIYLSFPSGVTMYGVIGGFIGAFQQWMMLQRVEKQVAVKAAEINAKNAAADKPSSNKPVKTINAKAK
jgi:YidC/Oxa1 family membrane protein insertase